MPTEISVPVHGWPVNGFGMPASHPDPKLCAVGMMPPYPSGDESPGGETPPTRPLEIGGAAAIAKPDTGCVRGRPIGIAGCINPNAPVGIEGHTCGTDPNSGSPRCMVSTSFT